MCGILLVKDSYSEINHNLFIDALNTLAHRGPDDAGVWMDNQIAIGSKRLSIIGVSNGHQPIINENQQVIGVVNGEIYNYKTLKIQLIAKGHKFITDSDSEVVVHLYEEYGMEFLSQLNGDFAIIIFDKLKDKIYAARDRFGVKPLVYFCQENKLIIASEAKAIIKMGIEAKLCREALTHSICYQYLPVDRTLFNNINQLRPGTYLEYSKGNMQLKTYWDKPIVERIAWSEFDYKGSLIQVRELLEDSIKLRLQSEKKICCCVSGGLDSSIVLYHASNLTKDRVSTFSMAFNDELYDETYFAKMVSNHLHSNHKVINITSKEILEMLPTAVYYGEGLAINGHISAKFKMFREIKKLGYDVALTGEGADECFYGYSHFLVDYFGPDYQDNNPITQGVHTAINDSLQLDELSKRLEYIPQFIKAKASVGLILKDLLSDDFLDYLNFKVPLISGIPADTPFKLKDITISNDLWINHALSNYILKVLGDGQEMASSIEGRPPFLDHRIYEYTKQIPYEYLITKNEKQMLKEAYKDLLPNEILARKKQPFMANNIVKESKEELLKIFTDTSFLQLNIINQKELLGLINNESTSISSTQKEAAIFTVLTLYYFINQFKVSL